MILVNIYEAKAKLSEYVEAAAGGERVLICNRNQPVAELRAIERKRTEPRPIGGGPHTFDVPLSFFEPLSDDELAEWDRAPVFQRSKKPARVAESTASYGKSRRRKRR